MITNYTYSKEVYAAQWTNPSDAGDRATELAAISDVGAGSPINQLSEGMNGAIICNRIMLQPTEWIVRNDLGEIYKVTNDDFEAYYTLID